MARGRTRGRGRASSGSKGKNAHPAEELRRLQGELKQGFVAGYLLRGEERYYRDRALTAVREAASARDWELCRHDALDPDFSLGRLLDDLTGGALFASARLVVLANVGPMLTKTGNMAKPVLVEALQARLGSGVEGSLAISVDSLRADNVVAKAIAAAGGASFSFRKLWDSPPPWGRQDPHDVELVHWLAGRAQQRGLTLSREQAAYVCAATGNDLYALDVQLDRIAEGGSEALAQTIGWQAGGTPWKVASALVDGDGPRAVAGVEALFAGGYQNKDGTKLLDPGGLITMFLNALSAKVREGLIAAEGQAGGAGRGRPAGGRSIGEWRRFQAEVGELERRSRSGPTVDESDLALLAVRWSQSGRRA